MDKLKVLLADTSVTSRKITADAVGKTSLGTAVHTAPNSTIALEWLKQCDIDVVILGAAMAGQGHPGLLAEMRDARPGIEVIILSNGDPESAEATIRALEQGAFDFILKTGESDLKAAVDSVRSQLDILFTQIMVKKYSMPDARCVDAGGITEPGKPLFGKPELVLIASSTGGPAAVETVLKQLPGNFPAPILVVQHMPAEFTNVFARNLDKICELDVLEAMNGSTVKNGQAVVAAGGWHMTVNRADGKETIVSLDRSPYINGVRPSADVLFGSAAKAFGGRNILAVILTGMGNDGTQGVSELKRRCNCYCITQSERTSVVYGMPRCVSEKGLSDESADIGDIAGRICRLTM